MQQTNPNPDKANHWTYRKEQSINSFQQFYIQFLEHLFLNLLFVSNVKNQVPLHQVMFNEKALKCESENRSLHSLFY